MPPSGSSAPPILHPDVRRARELRRMRLLATGLFVLAAAVYAATVETTGAWQFLNKAAEAAMVGALADWFAVTALFRHPLGLAIPHTAIIPTRKKELGRSLEEFVTANFLAEPVVRDKVARAGVSRRVGAWLADPSRATRLVAEVAVLVRGGLNVLRDEEVAAVVEQVLLRRLAHESWSPHAGRVLARVVEDGAHHPLVDLVLSQCHRWLRENDRTFARLVGERAPEWTPQWLDERVARRLHAEIVGWLGDVIDDPEHWMRRALDDILARFADDLQHDEQTMARAEAFVRRVLTHREVQAVLVPLWATVRRLLMEAVDDPDGELRRRAVSALVALGRRLRDDPTLARRVDGHAEDAVGYLVRTFGAEVATVISETVDRWDGEDAARRIELHVGRDLQFIRINGTVVGGLAGLGIYAVTVLIHRL